MAYPASVGVLWQVSERLAIRPDFTVAWTSTDSSSTAVSTGPFPPIVFETSSEGYTLGFGVSALWTVARWEPLRAYVTPRVGYRRSSATVTTTTTGLPPGVVGGIAPVTERTNTTTGFEVGGSFGAQHSLSERFALFGEVGINYSSLESPADLSPVQSTTIEARRPDSEHWFCKPSFAYRTHHLHLVPFGSAQWTSTLAFREHLRAHPIVAAEYATLKRRLAKEHRLDREAYTQAKEPFIARTTDLALHARARADHR